MAQVNIYLDKETKENLRAFVKARKISQSQWVANLIREKPRNEWPENITALAGTWKDFPTLEEIREEAPLAPTHPSFPSYQG